MAIAHVCPRCGADLALIRPRFEPVYGLPLVWCARCERPSVRWTHPVWRRWCELRAAAGAVGWLGLKLMIALGLWMLAMHAAKAIMDAVSPASGDPWPARVAVGAVVAAAVSHGAWITAGLGHLRRRAAWLGWAAFLYGMLGVLFLIGTLAEGGGHLRANAWDAMCFAIVFAVILLAAPAGIPLGRALLRARRTGRMQRLRRTRARRRIEGLRP